MPRSLKRVRAAADELFARRKTLDGKPCPPGQHWDNELGQCVAD